mgnify:CR=1 FL=1
MTIFENRLWAKHRNGFSLVELMVVVAIIGILAVIGIPQYQKFMAKARQAEAKTHLNSIFQGETSYFTEHGTYTGNMATIGAGAVGQNLRYNAGFVTAPCTGESGLSAPTAAGNNDIITLENAKPAANRVAAWMFVITDTAEAAITCGGLAYEAGAWGNPTNLDGISPNNANNSGDVFSMNQDKVLRQVAVGM